MVMVTDEICAEDRKGRKKSNKTIKKREGVMGYRLFLRMKIGNSSEQAKYEAAPILLAFHTDHASERTIQDLFTCPICFHVIFGRLNKGLQKAATIIILVCYLAGMFRMAGPVAGYWVNKSYIADVLCINKDKPKMSCDGKCYLMTKLKETSQKTPADSHSPSGTVESFEPFQHLHSSTIFPSTTESLSRTWYFENDSPLLSLVRDTDVPPPRFIV